MALPIQVTLVMEKNAITSGDELRSPPRLSLLPFFTSRHILAGTRFQMAETTFQTPKSHHDGVCQAKLLSYESIIAAISNPRLNHLMAVSHRQPPEGTQSEGYPWQDLVQSDRFALT